MNKIPAALWASLIVGVAVFVLTWWMVPRGIDPTDAAELARHAGDSAVASYKKSVADVIGPLEDSVRFYRGKAQAGVRIVVQRAGGSARDTTRAPAPSAADTTPPAVAVVVPPLIQKDGITIAETLHVSPPPVLLERRIGWAVDPDTIVAALIRTPEGLERFTAMGTRAGLEVRVVDAAVTRPPDRRALKFALNLVTVGSCALLGWGVGAENGTATTAGASGCAGGVVLGRLLH